VEQFLAEDPPWSGLSSRLDTAPERNGDFTHKNGDFMMN
jgi:hypothetical protein